MIKIGGSIRATTSTLSKDTRNKDTLSKVATTRLSKGMARRLGVCIISKAGRHHRVIMRASRGEELVLEKVSSASRFMNEQSLIDRRLLRGHYGKSSMLLLSRSIVLGHLAEKSRKEPEHIVVDGMRVRFTRHYWIMNIF